MARSGRQKQRKSRAPGNVGQVPRPARRPPGRRIGARLSTESAWPRSGRQIRRKSRGAVNVGQVPRPARRHSWSAHPGATFNGVRMAARRPPNPRKSRGAVNVGQVLRPRADTPGRRIRGATFNGVPMAARRPPNPRKVARLGNVGGAGFSPLAGIYAGGTPRFATRLSTESPWPPAGRQITGKSPPRRLGYRGAGPQACGVDTRVDARRPLAAAVTFA